MLQLLYCSCIIFNAYCITSKKYDCEDTHAIFIGDLCVNSVTAGNWYLRYSVCHFPSFYNTTRIRCNVCTSQFGHDSLCALALSCVLYNKVRDYLYFRTDVTRPSRLLTAPYTHLYTYTHTHTHIIESSRDSRRKKKIKNRMLGPRFVAYRRLHYYRAEYLQVYSLFSTVDLGPFEAVHWECQT